jgi:hypothetical protein
MGLELFIEFGFDVMIFQFIDHEICGQCLATVSVIKLEGSLRYIPIIQVLTQGLYLGGILMIENCASFK